MQFNSLMLHLYKGEKSYKGNSMRLSKHFCIYLFLIAEWLLAINSLEKNLIDSNTSIDDDSLLTTNSIMEITEEYNETEEMDAEFAKCGAFLLEPDDYIKLPNGSVYVEVYNKTYDPSAYIFRDGFLVVCPPKHENDYDYENVDDDSSWKFSHSLTYINRVGLLISMLCLTLHLIAFFMVPDMRNLPGYNLASLCFSLLFGYMFFMAAQSDLIQHSDVSCICVAAAFQFFMLSSFFWMSTLALDILRSLLKATGKLRPASGTFNCKKYFIHCLYSFGTSLLFVIVTLVLDYVEGIPDAYKPKFGTTGFCWFRQRLPLLLLFALPLIIIIILNVIFFGLSAYIIYSNRMKVRGDEAYKNMLMRNFLMNGRLATIMGIAWFFGILGIFYQIEWLWYINTIFSSFQGLFIFLAFTCTQKVKKGIIAILSSCKRKEPKATGVSPIFQSHWNSGLSLDDELDVSSECNVVKTEKV